MNYGELKSLVKQYLECEETTFVANIGQFVRLAEEDIYRQVQLQDLIEVSRVNLVPGTPYLALPQDFLSAYTLAIKSGNEFSYLLSKDFSFIREVYPNESTTGVPRFYAFFDDETIILGPTPDDDYLMELSYYYKPTSITDADNDTNETWLSLNGTSALLFGTILQGYIYLKGDQDVIKMYTDNYTQSVAALKIISEGRNRKDSYRKSDKRLPV